MRLHPVAWAKDPRLSIATQAYDAIAAEYDGQVRGDLWMRQVLHRNYRRLFESGDRVLDVGCGTGIDSIVLARAGVRVMAIDGSPAMVDHLRAKVTGTAINHLIEARVCEIQSLGTLDCLPFDGLIAAFASLSTLPDLAQFGDDAARLVRPGGRLVLHMLNRFSLWEWLGYVARRDWPAARQVGHLRMRTFAIGGQRVPHRLYFAREAYRSYFQKRFACRGMYSLGSLRPPHTIRRLPLGLVNALEWLDVRVGAWPLLRDAGRFFVLDLERLPG